MSRELLGEEPERVGGGRSGSVDGDLDLSSAPSPVEVLPERAETPRRREPEPAEPQSRPADLVVEDLDALVDAGDAPEPAGRRRGPRWSNPPATGRRSPVTAIAVGVVFAVTLAALTAYQQTQRAVTRSAAEASVITAWPQDGGFSQPSGDGTGRIGLELLVSGGVPLTLERIDVEDVKLNPEGSIQLRPGQRATAQFTFLADCGAEISAVPSATASARDQRGDPVQLTLFPVGGLPQMLSVAGCQEPSPAMVTDMTAQRDGAVTFTLSGGQGPPSRVEFDVGLPGTGNTSGPWTLDASPDDRFVLRPGDEVRVRLLLRYTTCDRQAPLPSLGGLVRISVSSDFADGEGYLEGWDESAVAAAATAAVLRACR